MILLTMNTDFPVWLREELAERHWTQAELAKRSGVSPAQITRVLSGERGLGELSIIAIAQALKLPPEQVYRKAGLLPRQERSTDLVDELMHYFFQLPEPERIRLVEYARFMMEIVEKEQGKKTK